MLPLIALGAVVGSVVGLVTGKKLAKMQTGFLATGSGDAHGEGGALPFRLVKEHVIQEESIILATEDVPLDNRFGNRVLVSEHEFSRTASTGLKLGQSHEMEASSEIDLRILESTVKGKVAKSIGTELGGQISRRIRLKFEVDPGKLVHYRVVWKQESRHGVMEIEIGGRSHQLPYMATYSLYHSVESLAIHGEHAHS